MTDKQSKELKKLTSPKRIVDELKSHLNLCSGSDIIYKVKELQEENDYFKIAMIKHTQKNYDEWKKEIESDAMKLIRLDLQRAEEENKKLQAILQKEYKEYNTMVEEYAESTMKRCDDIIPQLKQIILPQLYDPVHKESLVGYLDYFNTLQKTNKELKLLNINFKKEIENLQEEKDKVIDELECMNSTWETKEKEYEAEIKDKETIIEYLNNELDKYKKLFGEIKKETDKAKDIKGIMVNEDKTKITINGVELTIGDIFTIDNDEFILSQIYIGKTGKYSLRTDSKTIRLGDKFITGKTKIVR